jgi:hypothetical protein
MIAAWENVLHPETRKRSPEHVGISEED